MRSFWIKKWHVWLAVATAFLLLFAMVGQGASRVVICICLGVFYFSFYSLCRHNPQIVPGRKTILTPAVLFGAGYFIIFYLPYQAYLLGSFWIDYSPFFDRTYADEIERAIVASTVGILAFVAGVKALPERHKATPVSEQGGGLVSARAELLLAGGALVCVIGILFVSGGIATLLSGSYSGSSFNNRTSDGLYFMANMLSMMGLSVAVICMRGARRIHLLPVAVGALSLGWAIILLVMGDRNGFFLVAIAGVSAFTTYIRPISRPALVGLVLIALLLYQGVEASRQMQTRGINEVIQGMLDVRHTEQHLDESSFNASTIVTRAAFATVPEQYDYFRGKFKVIGFMGIVPFSRGLFISDVDPFPTSAEFLTFIMLGSQSGWSVGTTIVADIYLDFGIFGIAALMFAVGWWATYVTLRARDEQRSVAWGVLFSMTVALFAELPRYSLDFPIRNLVWVGAFFTAIHYLRKARGFRGG